MDTLCEHMLQSGVLHSPHIEAAFRAIDRKDFIPSESHALAYYDKPVHIGYNQTISQPSTVAFMLELLEPQRGMKLLDVGSGSAWTTALLAHITGPEGSVLGLERVEALVDFGAANLARYNMPHASIRKAGTELGAPTEAPFDRILVSASARSFPETLVSQLVERGIVVVPVRDAIWKATKVENQPLFEKYDGFVFVPLIQE